MSNQPTTRRRFLATAAIWTVGAASLTRFASSVNAKGAKWNSQFQLEIDFEISQPDEGRYHRPYVAVWIEDEDTLAVRTLALWVQQNQKGSRWLPDLKRWFRDEKERRVLNGGDLAKTVSSATKMPGRYNLTWDGKNDDGALVEQGKYTLCIEAAREHGTYQVIKAPLSIGNTPFQKELEGNVEIKSAKVKYARK